MTDIARTFGRGSTDEDSSRVPAFPAFTFFTMAYDGSTQSVPIQHESANTPFVKVRLATTGNCWIAIGLNPTAVVGTGIYMPAGVSEVWRVPVGFKIAAIKDTGAAAGVLSITLVGEPQLASVTVQGAVLAGADDAREVIATTVVNITDGNMAWAASGILGFRCVLDDAILLGKTILSASLTIFPQLTSSTVFTGRVRAEATGTPAQYQAVNGNISSRALTTAFLDVVNPAMTVGVPFVINGLETVVQEVIDAEALVAVAFQLTEVSGDSRTLRTIENSVQSSPAQLSITYQS